ncbi:PDR/VanB family oxidoreductase [Pelagibacterium lacus]|uniref:Oxidoreductase n=1 Tax=Pelagibacterium lacus TaxID=2282655 RepID=A0A369W5D4_9HYPH|nr:PDR/VanB family oxidoreductase [Pelagibacterium lacus]RDE09553.1 oxidoreductase [Pelagibacterium lacus]
MNLSAPLIADQSQQSLLAVRVHTIRYEAETIRSVELRSLDGAQLPPFTAGAHIDLEIPGGDFRSYSLVNSQEERHRYLIAVNRDPKSRGGSAYVCDTMRPGDIVSIRPPRNNFGLYESAGHSIFFGGGIGITPIISMISRLNALGRKWTLYYAVRSRAAAAYLDLIEHYRQQGTGRVVLHVDEDNNGGVLDIAGPCRDAEPDAHFYCCGPKPMIDAFSSAVAERPDDTVHVEHFSGTVEPATGGFRVVLARSGKSFDIPEGKTIMSVLLDNGEFVARSCQEGVCGTCETRVLQGIPDHKDHVLSARERTSNKSMMICCSGAKTDELVLDL